MLSMWRIKPGTEASLLQWKPYYCNETVEMLRFHCVALSMTFVFPLIPNP